MQLSRCLIVAISTLTSSAVDVIHPFQYVQTPNGFNSAPKGWNSFGLQATHQMDFTQANVIKQCDAMHANLDGQGYKYCSVDSGWSIGTHGDDFGRIFYDVDKNWDIPGLAEHLHNQGQYLGIYIVPGFFHDDSNKTIYGTNIKLETISDGNCAPLSRCQFNYSAKGVQEYCNSNVNQFAAWGVDLIKLDYVTPGSPKSNTPLDPDSHQVVQCYHNAIQQSGRKMRLDISWALQWNDSNIYNAWASNADSMRLDTDLNRDGNGAQTTFDGVQRTIEAYREYSLYMNAQTNTLSIHPDLDNLFVGNGQSLSGLTDNQRRIQYSHWIGAGANLLLGSDMTKLDTLGLSMLTDPTFNWIADNFSNRFPMRSAQGQDNSQKGKQWQVWIAGPSEAGEALMIWVNYGTGNSQLYADNPSGDTYHMSKEDLQTWGLNASCYSALNLWNPSDNVNLDSFLSLSVTLQSEHVVMLYLQPNETFKVCHPANATY